MEERYKPKRDNSYESWMDVNGDYDYDKATGVEGLDFRPKSPLHDRIIEEINKRCEVAKRTTTQCTPEWREVDKMLEGFMPESDYDKLRKADDARKPVTIVVPTMFTVREIFLSYLQSVFFAQAALQRYKGQGDEMATVRAALMERINMVQSFQFKERLRMDNWWSDSFKYGRGVVMTNWAKQLGPKLKVEEVDPLTAMQLQLRGMDAASGDYVRYFQDKQVLAEGTELRNIDMYQAFFDPNCPPDRIQESEFFGFVTSTNVFELMGQEHDPENRMFNCKNVRALTSAGEARSRYWNTDTGRGYRYGGGMPSGYNGSHSGTETNEVHVTQFLWRLIPSEWGLGDSDDAELWQFAIAGDRIIIEAHPVDEKHGKLPLACIAPNSDGHSVAPIGHLLTILNIQGFENWELKSRMDAVCTILNGLIFVDDSKVDMEDMMHPGQGKIVRVKNMAYGEQNIGNFVHQFQMSDPTAGHLNDVGVLQQMAMNGYDADLSSLPERPGTAGVQAMNSQRMGRLARIASLIDEQGMRDIALIKAFNTMQYMQEDVYVPIAGSYEEELRLAYGVMSSGAQVPVSPWDIGNFDFQVMPYTGNYTGMDDMAAMAEAMKVMLANPNAQMELQSNLRIVDMALQFYKKAGFTDIENFRRYAGDAGGLQMGMQQMPDEQVQQQVQAGNLVPAGAA